MSGSECTKICLCFVLCSQREILLLTENPNVHHQQEMGKKQSSTIGRRLRSSMWAIPRPQLLSTYWETEKHKFQAGNLLVCSMIASFCLRMVGRNVSPCCQYIFWFIVQRIMHQYPLHRISYCADDKGEKRFFSFIAKEADSERHMCFVFVSDKLVSNSKTGLRRIVRMKKLIIVIFFFLQHYGPFSLTLASFIIDAHSSLSNTFVLHRFTPSFLRSSSTSFNHLSLG